jgi:hypothetical protein
MCKHGINAAAFLDAAARRGDRQPLTLDLRPGAENSLGSVTYVRIDLKAVEEGPVKDDPDLSWTPLLLHRDPGEPQ